MTESSGPESPEFLEFGPFQLDGTKRALYRGGEYVPVTPKAFDTLLVLVEDAGHIVTREQLLERVWPDAFVEEGSITNNISALRKILNPYFEGEGPIATVARRGYRFTAPVRLRSAHADIALAWPAAAPGPTPAAAAGPAQAVGPEPVPAAAGETVPPLVSVVRATPWWRDRAALSAVVVVIIALAAIARFTTRTPGPKPATRRSVAVLAMKNLSGQQEQAWLSTALTETIGAELMAGGQFRLVSAESVARMQQELSPPSGIGLTRKQLDEIGRDLGCDLVLTGDYLAVGGKIRIDVRLDAVTTGEPIASASVTDEDKNVLALVGRAGSDLRTAMGITPLRSGEVDALRASLPTVPEATRAYFLGLDALRLRDGPRAAELLQQAIAAEPRLALAHAALSTTWRLLGYDARGAEEAKRAFDLAGSLSREDRLSVEAQYYEASVNWAKAIEAYGALWRAYPDNIEYGLKLAAVRVIGGHSRDAKLTIEQMRRLPGADGADPRIDLVEATADERTGDYRAALAAAGRAADQATAMKATLLLARSRLKQGANLARLNEPQQALARMEEGRQLFESLGETGGVADALRWAGATLIDRGQLDEGDKKLAAALGLSRQLHYVRLTCEILIAQSISERQRGALTAARAAAEGAVASAREADDASASARAMTQLGTVVKLQGDYPQGRALYAESAALLDRLGEKINANSSRNNLAVIDLAQGRSAAARAALEPLLQDDRKTGSKFGIATRLSNLSQVKTQQGDLEGAEALAVEECGMRDALGTKPALAACRIRLALLWVDLGRLADARAALGGVNPGDLMSSAAPPIDLARLVTLYLETGDRAKAASTLAAADRVLAGREYIPEQAIPVAVARARLDAASGLTASAAARFAKARSDAEKYGLAPLAFQSRLGMATLLEGPARRTALIELERDAAQAGLGQIAGEISRLEPAAKTQPARAAR